MTAVRTRKLGTLSLVLDEINTTAIIRECTDVDTTYKIGGPFGTETITNKTITDLSNDVAARRLISNNVVYNITGTPTSGQMLALTAPGTLAWSTPTSGSYPVTTPGDLIVGTGVGVVNRFGVGSDGQVLVSDSTAPSKIAYRSVVGGSGITVTYGPNISVAVNSSVVTLTGTQSLSGKTLVSPALNSLPSQTYAAGYLPIGTKFDTGEVAVVTDVTTNNQTQTLTNKTLITPRISSFINGLNSRVIGMPPASTVGDQLVSALSSQQLINKQLNAELTTLYSNAGTGRLVRFDMLNNADNCTTTLYFEQSANRDVTFPDASGVLVLDAAAQNLSNKNLIAPSINGMSIAAAPTAAGQRLVSTSTTAAAWSALAYGSLKTLGDNTTPTTFTGIVNPVQILGNWTLGLTDGSFDSPSNGVLRCNRSGVYRITVEAVVFATTATEYGVYLYRNGVSVDDSRVIGSVTPTNGGSVSRNLTVSLSAGDLLTLRIGNNTNTNPLTVFLYNIMAVQML